MDIDKYKSQYDRIYEHKCHQYVPHQIMHANMRMIHAYFIVAFTATPRMIFVFECPNSSHYITVHIRALDVHHTSPSCDVKQKCVDANRINSSLCDAHRIDTSIVSYVQSNTNAYTNISNYQCCV
eukprot:206032_1